MSGNFVEQKNRRLAAPVCHELGVGEDQTKEQSFLFAGG
jgi:hypothetical protein